MLISVSGWIITCAGIKGSKDRLQGSVQWMLVRRCSEMEFHVLVVQYQEKEHLLEPCGNRLTYLGVCLMAGLFSSWDTFLNELIRSVFQNTIYNMVSYILGFGLIVQLLLVPHIILCRLQYNEKGWGNCLKIMQHTVMLNDIVHLGWGLSFLMLSGHRVSLGVSLPLSTQSVWCKCIFTYIHIVLGLEVWM